MVSLSASLPLPISTSNTMKGNPSMTLTEKDKLIVAQVAVKAASELAAHGHIQTNAIGDIAADLYAEVFNLTQLTFGQPADKTRGELPHSLEQAAQAVEQAFPGAQRTEPTGPPESPKDALWRSALIDNPGEWWDNRTDKRNPKAPDFKAKNNGPKIDGQPAALWIDSKDKPAWVDGHLAVHG